MEYKKKQTTSGSSYITEYKPKMLIKMLIKIFEVKTSLVTLDRAA